MIGFHEYYATALDYANKVQRGFRVGRCVDAPENMAMIAALNVLAGDGDYCEIGTMFGGTAITVALTRRHFNVKGGLYCIDPLDGFYVGAVNDQGLKLGQANDPQSRVPITPMAVIENACHFDVKLNLIQHKSQPWPDEVEGHPFTVGYIDGNHWNNWPTLDFDEMRRLVTRFIVFDNVDSLHPAVVRAVSYALTFPEWKEYRCQNIQVVLERVNHD